MLYECSIFESLRRFSFLCILYTEKGGSDRKHSFGLLARNVSEMSIIVLIAVVSKFYFKNYLSTFVPLCNAVRNEGFLCERWHFRLLVIVSLSYMNPENE